MDELAIDLKTELDRIDSECIEYASDRYYASRLKLLVGMWEKGEAVSNYRGVNLDTSYRELERLTGRSGEYLKRWHEIYIKYPEKENYIEDQEGNELRFHINTENQLYLSVGKLDEQYYQGYICLDPEDVRILIEELRKHLSEM